ncbi:MAG: hypothetical protein EPN34_14710 [Burkholderiaceae bacterium]|nr:MAG: hypothetical protein EPN34_14710 [Burkholderiaceae bacterium]
MSRRTYTRERQLPLTLQQTLHALPPTLQESIKRHPFDRERDSEDLISETWLALLKAKRGTSPVAIFKRARRNTRRFGQDVAHYAQPLDARESDEGVIECASGHPRGEAALAVAARARCSLRTAQRRIKRMRAHGAQGDLFTGVPA